MGYFVRDVDFLFIYESRARELDSICLLGAWLEKRGYRVGYINTWDSMYHWHPEYRTKVALLSACYGDGEISWFTGHALGFEKVVNLQWEQVIMNGVAHSRGKNDWTYSGAALTTRHVCWGENSRTYLRERFGIADDYTRVCGYLPLDFYREELRGATPGREELFARYGLDPGKRTLLFISSFAEAGKPVSDAARLDEDEQESIDNVRLQERSQAAILSWFRRLLREQGDLQAVYRPHPAEANNPNVLRVQRETPGFRVIPQESIRNWIMSCDILCNWQSTSMIELYASGKPSLILRPEEIPWKRAMSIFEEGHFTAVKTCEELLAGVRAENAPFPVEEERLLRFYSMEREPAYQRVGEYLIETLEDPSYSTPAIGGRPTPKGRILHRAQQRANSAKAAARYRLSKLKAPENPPASTPKRQQIEEDYIHYRYYLQRMQQNRISPRALREKIDSYKKMIR